jgi:hypothetical protein
VGWGSCCYYVNEVCQLQNSNLIVPIQWLAKTHKNGHKTHHADAFTVIFDEYVSLIITIG